MPRWLVVCVDGTWSSNAEKTRFFSYPTNVRRISEALLNDGQRQFVTYLPGVGTAGGLDRYIGGVWGSGTTKRVCDGYRSLCEYYRPGDRLALFGFSRGAFAVRAITGVMARVGVLRADQLDYVEQAVSLWQRPFYGFLQNDKKEMFESFTRDHCYHPGKVGVEFIGVFDTVLRYGPLLAPLRLLLRAAVKRHFGLIDHRAPLFVKSIAHALALDECRAAFALWRYESHVYQHIEEVWFAGSHSDVGGGNADSRSAELSLQWMAERAANAGLVFDKFPSAGRCSHCAPLHPSRVGHWRFLPCQRRVVQASDRIHRSVSMRALATGYRPMAILP